MNYEKTMKEWDDSVPDGIKYLSAEKQVLMRRVRELESENARLKDAQRWIPVSERLPDNWESVLTIDISKSTRDMVSAFYNPETSLWSTHFSMYSDSDLWVTHWMPLPESPIVYGKVCIDQLTAHDATERKDDKSPNDTQTQTFVYGKESEE